jgi:hypothetical protein
MLARLVCFVPTVATSNGGEEFRSKPGDKACSCIPDKRKSSMNFAEMKKYLTTENVSFFSMMLLAFFVLSSKHIIIYNEETLVLLSFIAFVLFSYSMAGTTVENSLNERSQSIATELQNFLNLREQLIQELIQEHKKQLSVNLLMSHLGQFSHTEISHIAQQREGALQSVFLTQIEHKLKNLLSLSPSGPLAQKLQTAIAAGLRASVLEEFQRSRKVLGPQLVRDAVQALKTVS